jgi:hypothetical protein
MIKFKFNKAAREAAIEAIKKLETGSFVSAVAGSFGTNPKISAITSLILFVLCRVMETVIAGIVDEEDSDKAQGKPPAKPDGQDTS